MKNENHPDVEIISSALQKFSKGGISLKNFLDIAFNFKYKNISIIPLQKNN